MIFNRPDAFILAYPFLPVPQLQNTFTASPGGSGSIADSFLCIVPLQIRKIATILRLWMFDLEPYESDLLAEPSYRAGSITLQLVRPDITQSCSLLAAVRS